MTISHSVCTITVQLGLTLTLLGGCASVAVTSDAIERNTAFALGMNKADFTISERQDDGMRTTYIATTKAGKKYSCYATGTFSVTGRVLSDALCSASRQLAGTSGAGASGGTCNALLKAAGRC